MRPRRREQTPPGIPSPCISQILTTVFGISWLATKVSGPTDTTARVRHLWALTPSTRWQEESVMPQYEAASRGELALACTRSRRGEVSHHSKPSSYGDCSTLGDFRFHWKGSAGSGDARPAQANQGAAQTCVSRLRGTT